MSEKSVEHYIRLKGEDVTIAMQKLANHLDLERIL